MRSVIRALFFFSLAMTFLMVVAYHWASGTAPAPTERDPASGPPHASSEPAPHTGG